MRRPIRVVDNLVEPTVQGRERRPGVVIRGDEVQVIHYLVPEPGEEIDDTPPTDVMTRADWAKRHAEYGLTVDGKEL